MIKHPLTVGTKVEASQKTCACSGGKYKTVTGTILKTIVNHSGTWYYLDTGATIKSDLVRSVL